MVMAALSVAISPRLCLGVEFYAAARPTNKKKHIFLL
jgi:hypothetical protein